MTLLADTGQYNADELEVGGPSKCEEVRKLAGKTTTVSGSKVVEWRQVWQVQGKVGQARRQWRAWPTVDQCGGAAKPQAAAAASCKGNKRMCWRAEQKCQALEK